MSAIKRLKEIEKKIDDENIAFLVKSFQVMRDIAISKHWARENALNKKLMAYEIGHSSKELVEHMFDDEFETMMTPWSGSLDV